MAINQGPQSISDIFSHQGQNKGQEIKPPAYPWQDLALRVIKELGVPAFKRNSVFKLCKENSKDFIEKCLNETKELCQTGERWKYFFKVIDSLKHPDKHPEK